MIKDMIRFTTSTSMKTILVIKGWFSINFEFKFGYSTFSAYRRMVDLSKTDPSMNLDDQRDGKNRNNSNSYSIFHYSITMIRTFFIQIYIVFLIIIIVGSCLIGFIVIIILFITAPT